MKLKRSVSFEQSREHLSPLPREDRKIDLFKGFIDMTDFYDLFNTSWMVQKEDEVSIRIVNIITYPQKSLMR